MPAKMFGPVRFGIDQGGALYLEGAVVTLERCRFQDNMNDGLARGGGAIQANGATISAVDCQFVNNMQAHADEERLSAIEGRVISSFGGGAISACASSPTVLAFVCASGRGPPITANENAWLRVGSYLTPRLS